ncbi:helix-turn-helix domain-containing protein [Candidatus Nomurabacteria bacterium]|nr:helix-turn-helix domain-containing protein [Candidatus Nomurabacteria bacterium]
MKSTHKSPKNKEDLPELLTLEEASAYLKCHPNTLRQWDKKGILVALRFGARRDRKYRKDAIMKMLEQKI